MSESNDERSPGFKGPIVTKLIVVGLFLIAGTAGVFYYMKYCRDCRETATAKLEKDEQPKPDNANNEKDSRQSKAKTLTLKPVSEQEAPKLTKPPTNPSKSSFVPPPRTQVKEAGGSVKAKPGTGNSGLPASKSFSMPKVVAPQSDFASAANNMPSNNKVGFNPAKTNFQQPVEEPKQSISNRFQQLKNSTNQFASNKVQDVKQATGNFADRASNSLRSFGGANKVNTNPTGSTTRQQSSPPPIVPRASFDSTRDLNSNPPISKSSPIQNSLPPRSPSNNLLPRDVSAPVRSPQVGNINQSPPPRSLISSNRSSGQLGNSTANVGSSITTRVATSGTPGDRKLEGMQAPSVTIEKIAPREVQVNKPADFQLVVKNVGRIAANNVRVFDQIPAGTQLVQSAPQPRSEGSGRISWDMETLAPGQEKRIKIQLLPTTPGEIGSVAQVTFSAMASMRTKVTKPVLSIQHSTKPRVLVGDPVVLNIDVKNEGDGAATDVIIQEDLPEGLAFSEGYRELEYAIGTLGPGQSRKVRLELRAAKIGKYRNTLVAHAGGGLKTQHAVDLEVIAPELQATGDGPRRRFLKREATHRFSVRNSGTAVATNVELVTRLPSGLRFVSANNRGKYDENTHAVYWSLAELNSGLTANVELTTVPTEPGNQDLKFEAVSDLDQSANAICKLNVEHLVDVFFDIDDVVDPIEIGSDTEYRLRIVNQGTKTATNVQLQVDFPSGIQPTAVEGKINNEIRGQQIAFQPITSLNPGDQIEIMIRGQGITAGDHRISVNLVADGREVNVSKQESTRVYSDR